MKWDNWKERCSALGYTMVEEGKSYEEMYSDARIACMAQQEKCNKYEQEFDAIANKSTKTAGKSYQKLERAETKLIELLEKQKEYKSKIGIVKLSQGCLTHLSDVYAADKLGIDLKKKIKYFEKGNLCEEDAITIVSRVMKENFADSFALGIIDKDKIQVDYLNEFTEVINAGSLLLHKHKNKHHYIIQINPVVETFIIDNAKAVGISITDFNLPDDKELFKKESKQEQSKKDLRFKGLFKAIKNAGAGDFIRLSQWVLYLRDATYNADINELQ